RHHEGEEGMASGRAAATLQWWRRRSSVIDVLRSCGSCRATELGVNMKKIRTVGEVSLSALEDQWQRNATAAAIEAARGVAQMDGPIPPRTPIARLTHT